MLDSGEREKVSHLIAEHFLITVRRPDQIWVDHITHYPEGININDVRNLRWCNHAENNTFEEALRNRKKGVNTPECKSKMRAAKIGYIPWNKGKKCTQTSGEKNPRWNPDKEGMKLRRREYMNARRAAKRKAKQLI